MRVVFNAGAKFQSPSLNENLFKGPDLLNSLIGVLIRFGKEEFALCGDIKQISTRLECVTMTAMHYAFCGMSTCLTQFKTLK